MDSWTDEFPQQPGFYAVKRKDRIKVEQFHITNIGRIIGKRGYEEDYKSCLFKKILELYREYHQNLLKKKNLNLIRKQILNYI